ncbi:MAG: NAD-dependent epimerase/dehydratase family protein [Oligoflexia bacterium]|nr:NAD-dependent epimerase/dehydratase family protein [Oligoflexia bacterium]
MKKTYLVTGGAGFVGSHLSRELVKSGSNVVIADDLSNGKQSNIPDGAKFIRGDLSQNEIYLELSQYRFDAILHLAAQASNAISFLKPYLDLNANQVSTMKLLEFAKNQDCKRFLFTSSMSAYGQPRNFPTLESEPLNPDSPYGAHKAASEHYLRMFTREYGFETTTFRLYTTYGGGQNLENLDQGLLSIYLAYLVQEKPIVVKGALERKRDIVHVSDVVSAILSALATPRSIGKTYNLCSGTSYTIREILDELIKEMGFDPKKYPVEVQPGTPGDPPVSHGSFSAAARDLDYSPKVKPFDGIHMTVESYRQKR